MAYDIEDFDENGVLKPGFLLYVCTFILCRQIFYGPLSFFVKRSAKRGGVTGQDLDLSFIEVTTLWEFVACIPGLVVLCVLFSKKPFANKFLTKAWLHGRQLLLLGLILQIGVLIMPLFVGGYKFHDTNVLVLALHCFVLVYLVRSHRIRDVFKELPFKK